MLITLSILFTIAKWAIAVALVGMILVNFKRSNTKGIIKNLIMSVGAYGVLFLIMAVLNVINKGV